jgi:hypothetical protein
MPTKCRPPGHNVRVTRSVFPPRARAALVAVPVALALLVSACGTDNDKKPSAEPSVDLPTGNVAVPSGLTLTKAGTQLAFKEPAIVAYEPNTKRNSVLAMTVDSVQAGRISDFASYQLDDRTKKSRPYYVKVRVRNAGTGDLSRSPIPLYAVDSRNTLIQPSSFNNSFTRCPSTPLPAGFVGGKSYAGCLVYLVPAGGNLQEMSFRPLQDFEPITWKGTITPAVTKKPTKKPKPKNKEKN